MEGHSNLRNYIDKLRYGYLGVIRGLNSFIPHYIFSFVCFEFFSVLLCHSPCKVLAGLPFMKTTKTRAFFPLLSMNLHLEEFGFVSVRREY